MIEYHNPTAEAGVEVLPYTLSKKIRGANKVSVGMLANGFPDSEAFLAELAEVLNEKEAGIEIHAYNKGNASIPASPEILGH